VPGFYDGVDEIAPALRAQWRGLAFDARAFLGAVGLSLPAGEAGRDVLEMLWSRPTCEFNGISGGYAGEGFKTVLPARASAKVSFRLVSRQDPLRIRESFRAMVRAMVPADCKVAFRSHGASPASHMNTADPAFEGARTALSAEWGRPAAFVGAGGSIPVAGYFHSPNEKYDVACFHKGIRSWARVLDAISR
jgi:acetylornithine deacetylase/succinyl-diaminopimelate desuccinylase-like protein